MMVMYVHEPSLMVVICKGKTIQGTWPDFRVRLEQLLSRFRFPATFIKDELAYADEYIVSKTGSRSMLAFMNRIVFELSYQCSQFPDYDSISLTRLEDWLMDRLHQTGKKQGDYSSPLKYWQREIGFAS